MKHNIINYRGSEQLPTEDEVKVANILLTFPKIILKSELINRYSFTWGVKKKRSVLNSSVSPSPLPLTERRVGEDVTEKVTAADADKSPSTPLSFLPSGSGSDCVDKRKSKTSSSGKKRKATNDLVESYNRMHQEREILLKETKAMKTLHQELSSTNRELKAIIQKVNYTRNIEDFHKWSKSMKIFDQQSYPQITMFAPPTTQQQQLQQRCQHFVAVSCSGNSHSGGGFGMFNQVDPRVKIINGEAYDFMGCSQPLDQSKYLMMDNDLRMRTAAAAARQRRIMRRKENKNASLALKLSRGSR
ncbi:hypothetical protein M8C21_026186 [Ambrosia artemisiifolia]|uniref:Uncharacterized protein n=1 Tax=Ambrosia artemisiifolia TaxID=4212 RepID=A0AAD5G357_AMBAR|nr:hypothetical protein M8C21_026186 [Ambrosia artemisiifolia]